MTYDDITIGLWMDMEKAASEYDTVYQQAVARIAILTDKDFDELWSMPLDKYGKIQRKYEFLTTRPKTEMITEFEGHPIVLDFKKLPFGDFVDLMEILKSQPDRIDMIVAKLWQSGLPLTEGAKVIRERMKCSHALGLSAFFFEYCERLQPLILLSLARQRRRMEKQLGMRTGLFHRMRGYFGLIGYRIATLLGGNRSSK